MKTTKLSALIALSAMSVSGVLANQEADLAPIYLDRTAITVDAGYMMDIDNLSVDSLCGGTIGMSYIFNRTAKSAHSIGLTFGYFDGNESGKIQLNEPLTAFTDPKYPGYIFATGLDYYASEKISQTILPIIFSYQYHRDITNSISAYVGARGGVYITKSTASRKSDYSKYLGVADSPENMVIGADVMNETSESSHTSICPTVGLEIGIAYQFAKNWSWHIDGSIDVSYKMIREHKLSEHSNHGLNAVQSPETSKDTAISTTIRTGFSYQF